MDQQQNVFQPPNVTPVRLFQPLQQRSNPVTYPVVQPQSQLQQRQQHTIYQPLQQPQEAHPLPLQRPLQEQRQPQQPLQPQQQPLQQPQQFQPLQQPLEQPQQFEPLQPQAYASQFVQFSPQYPIRHVQTNIQPNSSIVYTAHASQPRIEMNQPIFQPQQQEQQLKRDEDISMLLFILGFLCHWIWLIAYLKYRNSPAPRAQMFARYSRNIFMFFIIFAVTSLLIWCLILSYRISSWK